jgi:hypothetical protein
MKNMAQILCYIINAMIKFKIWSELILLNYITNAMLLIIN